VFHIVAAGTSWLQLKGRGEPIPLSEGDFAVVRRAQYHTMQDSPTTPAVDFADLIRTLAPGKKGAVCAGGTGPVTRLVCGGIEDRKGHPLMAGLPPLLGLKGGDSGSAAWVRSTVKHILAELNRGGTGAIEVANRLVDILFLHAVRLFLDETAETGDSGWLAAIRDQQIGRALAAIHCNPHHSWTVESLARHVAMSRTTFAAKFRELVGEPPQHYFTRLRISAAAVRLRSGHEKSDTPRVAGGLMSWTASKAAGL
jgi:AraC-like DNA-binding protein